MPADARQSPQDEVRNALLAPGIPAYPRPRRKLQDRPVTPEVAGSSPVAPVESPCEWASSVACTGATDRRPPDRSRLAVCSYTGRFLFRQQPIPLISRRHQRKLSSKPCNPRTDRVQCPALVGNPRLLPVNPEPARPACHAGGRGFESRRSRRALKRSSSGRHGGINGRVPARRDPRIDTLLLSA